MMCMGAVSDSAALGKLLRQQGARGTEAGEGGRGQGGQAGHATYSYTSRPRVGKSDILVNLIGYHLRRGLTLDVGSLRSFPQDLLVHKGKVKPRNQVRHWASMHICVPEEDDLSKGKPNNQM